MRVLRTGADFFAFTITGAFGFYAGLNVLAFIGLFFLLPETKQRTLEELDSVFAVPTSQFISYNVNKGVRLTFAGAPAHHSGALLLPPLGADGQVRAARASLPLRGRRVDLLVGARLGPQRQGDRGRPPGGHEDVPGLSDPGRCRSVHSLLTPRCNCHVVTSSHSPVSAWTRRSLSALFRVERAVVFVSLRACPRLVSAWQLSGRRVLRRLAALARPTRRVKSLAELSRLHGWLASLTERLSVSVRAMPKAKSGFYAVSAGRQPGVYTTWPEAEAQVSGFKGAVHAKCSTRAEAEAFVQSGRRSAAAPLPTKPQWRSEAVDDEPAPRAPKPPRCVYTDGSCGDCRSRRS